VRALDDADVLRDHETQAVEPFNPTFTYPIYGEKEVIFGYKNLSVQVGGLLVCEDYSDSQLSFVSGSLKQLLEVTFDEKLESEATPADDVEGLLYNFIPPDYTKSSFAFEQLVEAEATSFKPPGEKIGSYVRQAAIATKKSKGKGKANGAATAVDLDVDDENAVVFEMYKVRERWYVTDVTEQLGDTRLPRISSTDAAVHLALHRRRQLCACEQRDCVMLTDRKTKTLGSSSLCSNVGSDKEAISTPITLSVMFRCIPFGVTPTRCDCA